MAKKSNQNVLQLENLTKYFGGVPAVNDISFL